MAQPPLSRPTPPATVHAWAGARWADTRTAALFALDETLGQIVRSTSQPIVGQMRLTWWHGALVALDHAPPQAHPVLIALAAAQLPGARLAGMVDGWEALLEEVPSDDDLMTHATARGATLFALATGAEDAAVTAAGGGWALADLAVHVSDPALATRAQALATAQFQTAFAARWPARLRVIGALAQDALAAMQGAGAAGSPSRAARVVRFRLFGR